MRRIKFWAFITLMIFAFMSGGCGGSAGSDSESSESDLHSEVISILEGQWEYDSGYSATATIAFTDSDTFSATLTKSDDLSMSFSDIEFASDSDEAAANLKVYYSHSCSAFFNDAKIDEFSINSYLNSDSTIYKDTVLMHVSDNRWRFTAKTGSDSLRADIVLTSETKMHVTLVGTSSSTAGTRSYTIDCDLIKTNKTPKTDYAPSSGSDDTDTTDIANTLEGTWLFSTGENAGETEKAEAALNDGSNSTLTLRLASNVSLDISDITLNDVTSLTGTVKVKYAHKWTAFDNSNKMQGEEGDFTLDKDETMKIIHVSGNIWRIEDIEDKDNNKLNENIILTVNSSNEIKTLWTGTKVFRGTKCTYTITCSFRKQK